MCSGDFVAREVNFIANGYNEITFNEDTEPELRYRLQNDDKYALRYITQLIATGQIPFQGELHNLIRMEKNGSTIILETEQNEQHEEEEMQNVEVANANHEANEGNEWSQEQTRFLLDKYEMYLRLIGPLKKFKNKRQMWQEIANNLKAHFNLIKSPTQVENRFKTVMKRRKKAVNTNRRTGEVRNDVEYETELNKIAAIDDSLEPEVLRGVTNVTTKSTEAPTKKSKNTLKDVLVTLHDKKEEAKERRHKEKMNLLKDLISVIKDKN